MSLKKIELKQHVSLKGLTTIKIGGTARYFFIAHTREDLTEILKDTNGECYLLGRGSNLLIKDSCVEKPVVKLGEEFDCIRADNEYLEVGGATSFSRILNHCLKNKLSGLHNLAGIPASCGGLLRMNASSFKKEISAFVTQVEVMDKAGNTRKIPKEALWFGYRSSSLKDYIILRAWFALQRDEGVKNEVRHFLKMRRETQDFTFPSCGCIFKNPSQGSASFFIDQCGLKGLAKNGAQVSLKHANFIINVKNASYQDVDYLIALTKERVHQKFGVILEEEIERWV
jgi:UDP-N-acetylmuramate dehydrogenase